MSAPSQFLADAKFFGHFVIAGTEDQDMQMVFDTFFPIGGALLGLPRRQASRRFLDATVRGPGYDPTRTSLTDDVLAVYRHLAPDAPETVRVFPVMAPDRYQVLTQQLAGGAEFRITYWISTSAVTGYISLLFAHVFHLFTRRAERAPAAELDRIETRAGHFQVQCRFLNTAVAEGGSYVLKDTELLPCLENTSNLCKEFFLFALMFMVFHEIGHVRLGHFRSRERALPAQEKAAQELEADGFALAHAAEFDLFTPWGPLVGALIALLGESLTSAQLDSRDGPAHPSLVHRAQHLCRLNDRLAGKPAGDSWEFATPFIINLITALFDRDRCPCWFGRDRRAVMGLPPDHDFEVGPRRDFRSGGGSRTMDANPRPAQARPFRWKKEPEES